MKEARGSEVSGMSEVKVKKGLKKYSSFQPKEEDQVIITDETPRNFSTNFHQAKTHQVSQHKKNYIQQMKNRFLKLKTNLLI